MTPAVVAVGSTSPELVAEGDAAAAWAATTLAGLLAGELAAGRGPDALYVATPDAGAREALAFWRSATETGYRFASPAGFPWTLSNSPTGRISLELGITGPCLTLVGADEAVAAARETALADLAYRLVERPLVVHLRGDRPVRAESGPVRLRLSAWLYADAAQPVGVR